MPPLEAKLISKVWRNFRKFKKAKFQNHHKFPLISSENEGAGLKGLSQFQMCKIPEASTVPFQNELHGPRAKDLS